MNRPSAALPSWRETAFGIKGYQSPSKVIKTKTRSTTGQELGFWSFSWNSCRVLPANQIRALRFVPFPFGFRPSGFGFFFPLCGSALKSAFIVFFPSRSDFGLRVSAFDYSSPLCGLCVKIRVHRFLPLPFGFEPWDFGLRFPVVPTLQKSPFFKAFQTFSKIKNTPRNFSHFKSFQVI